MIMKQFTNKFKHWLTLSLLLVFGLTSASAYDTTINQWSKPSDNEGMLPVYGIFAGSYQKCELVVPSDLLGGVNGTAINGLTFYVAHGSQRVYLGKSKVFLKEVDFTAYTTKTYSGMEDATVVYEGGLDATAETMQITFTQPYNYKGGNLLIGIYIDNVEGATGGSVRFYGIKDGITNGISGYNKDVFKFYDNFITLVDFLPTMTFDCEDRDWMLEGDDTHGDITFTSGGTEVTTSKKDKEIIATITPDDGYIETNVSIDDVDVTDNGDGTYTFTMPDKDVYVNTNWKRDITDQYKVDATGPRIIEWTGNPLNPDFKLIDVLDPANPVDLTKGTDYTVAYKTKEGAPVDPLVNVGEYIATVTGIGNYYGTFDLPFTVQKKHTVTLAAHYFGTYFYATGIETFDDMDLATVTAVAADGTATLTKLTETKIAKNYPFLIYNPFDEEKTFTLWETIDDPNVANPTPAAQFTGTADAKAFTADETAAKDYYVLQNHKVEGSFVPEFVYVIGAGTKPAHRCWIELPKAAGSRLLTITIDQTTGISEVKAAQIADGIYDLQGRRLTGKPSQRGMYVIDGKKVIVK